MLYGTPKNFAKNLNSEIKIKFSGIVNRIPKIKESTPRHGYNRNVPEQIFKSVTTRFAPTMFVTTSDYVTHLRTLATLDRNQAVLFSNKYKVVWILQGSKILLQRG